MFVDVMSSRQSREGGAEQRAIPGKAGEGLAWGSRRSVT